MKAFDLAWTLLKQGKVRRGFGDSPFPRSTPMQDKDIDRRRKLPSRLEGGARPETLRGTHIRDLERDNVMDPYTGEMIPDFIDGSPNPAAGPVATIGASYDEIQRVLTKLMSGEPLTPQEEVILNQQRQQL